MQAAALLLALPLAAAQLYANGSSYATSSRAVPAPKNTPAPTSLVSVPSNGPQQRSNDDQTTYVTVVEGKTLTLTTKKPSSSVAPAPKSTSNDQTTYVTVVEGKTLTLTTQKPSSSIAPVQGNFAQPSPSNDQTTYVTVIMGKTMTITTQKPSPTEVALNNGANLKDAAAPLAFLAGAAALLI